MAGLNENNAIIANAFAGSGGQTTLTAQSIFGFEVRTRQDLQQRLITTDPAALDPLAGRSPSTLDER
ncbi:hypothetical protein IQ250_17590 [Pseudanabaenaceae cyanobacterium LEGE 13415]|nr:hypothetical protein [Pseudanabaenaceae cyanobacterium LEGE 13415]